MSISAIIPAFASARELTVQAFHGGFAEARDAWLSRSPSINTRENYARDLTQFLTFAGINGGHLEQLAAVRPHQVAAWRDLLREKGILRSDGIASRPSKCLSRNCRSVFGGGGA